VSTHCRKASERCQDQGSSQARYRHGRVAKGEEKYLVTAGAAASRVFLPGEVSKDEQHNECAAQRQDQAAKGYKQQASQSSQSAGQRSPADLGQLPAYFWCKGKFPMGG
jgi:hypothetical protein